MSDIIQLVPNKWVTEELFNCDNRHVKAHDSACPPVYLDGGKALSCHVAPDMAPKQNSPIMYNRDEINHWFEHQSPAKRRRISA